MLPRLRKIIQQVNRATNLQQALDLITKSVSKTMSTDVCSVYLMDNLTNKLVLSSSQGLNKQLIGQISLGLNEGLVGLVAEKAELINLSDASQHPRFRYFPETGEASFHGFLGAPIIQHGDVLGVLAVQIKEQTCFGEDEETFLFTLAAQLAGAIIHANTVDHLSGNSPQRQQSYVLKGQSGAFGLGFGRGIVIQSSWDIESIPDRTVSNVDEEEQRFFDAISQVKTELKTLGDSFSHDILSEHQAVFNALIMLLESKSSTQSTVRQIRQGNWAPGALRHTLLAQTELFESMEDAYLKERVADLQDLSRRVLHYLGYNEHATPLPEGTEKIILVGDDVGVTQLSEIPADRLAGIISSKGSSSSHLAILARGLGVPAVVGVADLPLNRLSNRELIVDGDQGTVTVDPTDDIRAEYQQLKTSEVELNQALAKISHLPAVTQDDQAISLQLNIGLTVNFDSLTETNAEGVGLYRTEFPFIVRDQFPGEDEQTDIYRQVLSHFTPLPVILRTLDIGGDKSLPYFPIEEENPFLGWRGIRISLDHPELFLVQIRAMLKANENNHNLEILLPMVTTVSEVKKGKKLIKQAERELQQEGFVIKSPKIGVMIEVPSMLYSLPKIAPLVDFFSIGSNDLTQYLLAVDRNNHRVAELYHHMHPAVLQAVFQAVTEAKQNHIPISLCGELAGDPLATALVIGMGFEKLSMIGGSINRVKTIIRKVTIKECQQLLEQALAQDEASEVVEISCRFLQEHELSHLVQRSAARNSAQVCSK